jgi:hypothetical protein
MSEDVSATEPSVLLSKDLSQAFSKALKVLGS